MVENVAGVMPKPNNLDQAEDDAHIPLHQSGPDGKMLPEDDDQDPDGQVGIYFVKDFIWTLFSLMRRWIQRSRSL